VATETGSEILFRVEFRFRKTEKYYLLQFSLVLVLKLCFVNSALHPSHALQQRVVQPGTMLSGLNCIDLMEAARYSFRLVMLLKKTRLIFYLRPSTRRKLRTEISKPVYVSLLSCDALWTFLSVTQVAACKLTQRYNSKD
jgi:hypothetical protein